MRVCLTPRSSVPDRSAVAMGGAVIGALLSAGSLYGGVPTALIRSGVDACVYFKRSRGFGDRAEAAETGLPPNTPRRLASKK